MKGPTPRRLKKYVGKCLRLKAYLRAPGDGRTPGRIPAAALLWGLIVGVLLRRAAFAGIEALVCSQARRALDVSPSFGDDALAYCTARLDPAMTRRAAVTAVRQAKRTKPSTTAALSGWPWMAPAPDDRAKKFATCAVLMAKSRWEIENQGFNDAKNRHGLEHICHHEGHSLLGVWLLTCLALTIERLYRGRYLHRGTHPVRAAIDLLLLFQLSWGSVAAALPDSS